MRFNVPAFDDTYDIICELNSGGGGIIYKAYHKRLNKYVAVKRIKNSVKDKIDVRGEADILKNLRHAYLPQVYDFIEVGDEYFTVIDFIDGVSFDSLIKQGQRFSQERIIKWCRQLCEAVCYLHSQTPPIIHSDIKPANVMLTPTDDICLIDFNISLVVNGDVSAIGKSDGYSPPEQYVRYSGYNSGTYKFGNTGGSSMSGHYYKNIPGTIDERADIYSIGATLYHMLTLEKPAIATHPIKPLDAFNIKIENGLKHIIETAMQPNPANRFQSAQQMLAAVHNIAKLNGEYKKKSVMQIVTVVVVAVLVAAFAALTVIGKSTMDNEKAAEYQKYVDSARDNIEKGKYEKAIEAAVNAQAIDKERVEPYYLNAYALFRSGEYRTCAEYSVQKLATEFKLEEKSDKEMLANLHHILGRSYLELNMPEEAEESFENAIDVYDGNAEIYRDYAIALAENGKFDESEEMLENAKNENLGDASVYLVQGEIYAAKGNYESAVAEFERSAGLAEEKELKLRAFLAAADIYRNNLNDYLGMVSLLEYASGESDLAGNAILTEKLGEAYSYAAQQTQEDEYYFSAIECFKKLIDAGDNRYYLYYNISVLYRSTGNFETAIEWLLEADEMHPEKLETYLTLALIEIEMQAYKDSYLRSYSKAYEYYLVAEELYSDSAEQNSDMLLLRDKIEDLKVSGRLN